MNHRICLYVPPIREINSYYQLIDFAVENNIKYIETINQYELATPNIDEAKKLKLYADKKGVSFPFVSLCIDLVGENREKNVNIAKQYADVASVIGAKYLHHTIAMEYTDPNRISSNFDLFYKQGIQSVREVYDYADKIGVRTVYEDQGYLFNGLKTFRTFLNDVERNVGVVADFGNIMFVEEQIDDFISEFSDRIVNIHLKDYVFSSTNDNKDDNFMFVTKYGNYLTDCPLKKGNVDFDSAFKKVAAIGYHGTFSLECPPIEKDDKKLFDYNIGIMNSYINKLL